MEGRREWCLESLQRIRSRSGEKKWFVHLLDDDVGRFID